jgi:hypothetical protein
VNDTGKRFLWVSIYAIAMALLEAVVVAYIRALIDIADDHVSLGAYARMELWREVATIVMLVSVGWMAGRRWLDRLAYGLFVFGMWDVWYYVWLRVLIGWPETLLDWDILFLIPVRWWGPVLAPVLVAVLICVTAVLAVRRMDLGERLSVTPARWGTVLLGVLLALYVFMADALHALLQGQPGWNDIRPGPFKWPLFLIALVLMGLPSLMTTWPRKSGTHHIQTSQGDVL